MYLVRRSELFYELRIYDIKPGRLGDFVTRFGKTSGQIGAYKRSGIDLVGCWTDDIGTSNRFTYMLKWKDNDDKETNWKTFVSDKQWTDERTQSEKHDGPWVINAQNSYLKLTAYSPEPRISKPVTELRIYTTAPGKMADLHGRFSDYTMDFFAKHHIDTVGFWTHEVGNSNQLLYMLEYSNLDEREQKWGNFQSDPEWISTRAYTERNGPIVTSIRNSILRPPSYLIGK